MKNMTDHDLERAHLFRWVALGQGLYFILTGLWPLLSMRTFQLVTGPKTDRWLVNTVGVLVLTIGAVLTRAAFRDRVAPDLPLLAMGSAAGLAGIDVIYVARRRIARIYLLDALAEATLLGLWAAQLWRSGRDLGAARGRR